MTICVTPMPSTAAWHIASGSSNAMVAFSGTVISSPAALRIGRSRTRRVFDERMTMPSNAASPDGSAGGVRPLR